MVALGDSEHDARRGRLGAGLGRLTVDAVRGVVDLVEAVHRRVARLGPGSTEDQSPRLPGLAGQIYENIRGMTDIAGDLLVPLLTELSAYLEKDTPSETRDALVSAINGVLGDHLAASGNALAIQMSLFQKGQPIDVGVLTEQLSGNHRGVLLMIHGVCMNDRQWCRNGHDHGVALAETLGFIPVYLRYNSGLHISENGRCLAKLLATTWAHLPPGTELRILAHSMGGLVARSACFYAEGHEWLQQLQSLIFMGTPHHGAPLERLGHVVDQLLSASSYSKPFGRLTQIRGAGITDLRYGNVTDEDWQGPEGLARGGDRRKRTPLPPGVACYAIAGATADLTSDLNDLVGDGLVPVDSALGRHADLDLGIPPDHQWIARGVDHQGLLDDGGVYEQIKTWLQTEV